LQRSVFYAAGQKVFLKAQPSPFATFVAWGGDCTGKTTTSAALTLTKDLSCTVQFQSNFDVAAQQMVQGFYADATTAAGAVATTYFQQFRAQKIRVGTQDLKIAAIVLSHQATLVTRNQKDFTRLPNLKITDWSGE
jgi:hypothetical protein